MAIDKCDPCQCPEMHYRDSMSWRKAVLYLLCKAQSVINASEQMVVTLGTLIAGEDQTNNWMSANLKGYLLVRSVRFNYSSTAANTEKTINLGVAGQYWTFSNTTASVIWVGFGAAAIAIPANDAAATSNLFPIPANSVIDIYFQQAAAANQLRVENVSVATGDLFVTVAGNA